MSPVLAAKANIPGTVCFMNPELSDPVGRPRAQARVGGLTILFAPDLKKARQKLHLLRFAAPKPWKRFTALCTCAAQSPKMEGISRWAFTHPGAFAYTVFKLRESLRDTEWSVRVKKRDRKAARASPLNWARISFDLGKLAVVYPLVNDGKEPTAFLERCADPAADPIGAAEWFEKYPDASCYVMLKAQEIGRKVTWSIQLRRHGKPRTAKPDSEIRAASSFVDKETLQGEDKSRYSLKELSKQTKEQENAGRAARDRSAAAYNVLGREEKKRINDRKAEYPKRKK